MTDFQDPQKVKELYSDAELITDRGIFLKKHSNRKLSIRDLILNILEIGLSNHKTLNDVLDFGCGSCSFLDAFHLKFPQSKLYGTDIIFNKKCKKSYIHYIEKSPIQKYENHYQNFDVIVCMNVLYHIKDILSTLQMLKLFLRPTGRLIVTTKSKYTFPYIENLYKEIMEEMQLKLPSEERDEHHFCIENADSYMDSFFLKKNIKKYILKTQIITLNHSAVLKYILSTRRYSLLNVPVKHKSMYISKWKEKISQKDYFIDEYIEGLYDILI